MPSIIINEDSQQLVVATVGVPTGGTGSTITLGDPTTGDYTAGLLPLTSATLLADAMQSVNLSLAALPIGDPTTGDYTAGLLPFTSVTLLPDAIQSINVSLAALGNVIGPASSVDEAVARWDGTTGELLQDGTGTNLTDTGFLTLDGGISAPDTSFANSEKFGAAAIASAIGATSVGAGAQATHQNSIALGASTISTAVDRMTVGTAGTPVDFQTFGKIGAGTAPGSAMVHAQSDAAATVGAIVQGATSQSANLQEWQTSTGLTVAAINSSGNFSLSFPAQFIGQNVGLSTFVGMRMPSSGLVELHASNTVLAGFDTQRISFQRPLAWATTGTLVGSHFEFIKNLGANLFASDVVVMSGGTKEVTISTSANQQGVMVATVSANTNANTRVAAQGVFNVFVEALEVVAAGDKLVSSATAATAKVDNTETDPSKIIGYVWESKTVGSTRETVLCKLI